jgi:hypothetical protein
MARCPSAQSGFVVEPAGLSVSRLLTIRVSEGNQVLRFPTPAVL